MTHAISVSGGLGRRRWMILSVIGLAQLMVVLDPAPPRATGSAGHARAGP